MIDADWELGSVIHSGRGTVRRARAASGAHLAVKWLPFTTEARRREALAQVEAARKAPDHPGLAKHVDDFVEGANVVLVTEWLDGVDLERLRNVAPTAAMPATAVAAMVGEVAAALAALHDVGIVHGDVKPANVVRTRAGRHVLVDVGSVPGVGTAGFVAPEALHGPPTPAGDVYSLAATAASLLCGGAFTGGRRTPALRGIPGLVRDALEHSLHPHPSRRPSAASLAALLSETVTFDERTSATSCAGRRARGGRSGTRRLIARATDTVWESPEAVEVLDLIAPRADEVVLDLQVLTSTSGGGPTSAVVALAPFLRVLGRGRDVGALLARLPTGDPQVALEVARSLQLSGDDVGASSALVTAAASATGVCRARCSIVAAHLAADRSDFDGAWRHYEDAAEAARDAGADAVEGAALGGLSSIAMVTGRPEEGHRLAVDGVRLRREAEHPAGLCVGLVELAATLPPYGNGAAPPDLPPTAEAALAQAVALAERLRHLPALTAALVTLSGLLRWQGELDAAAAVLHRVETLAVAQGNQRLERDAQRTLAVLEWREDAAAAELRRLLHEAHRRGDRLAAYACLVDLADDALRRADTRAASLHLQEAEQLRRTTTIVRTHNQERRFRAMVAAAAGNPELPRRHP